MKKLPAVFAILRLFVPRRHYSSRHHFARFSHTGLRPVVYGHSLLYRHNFSGASLEHDVLMQSLPHAAACISDA